MFKPEVIIAALALFIAIWQVISTRRHNRLSVRPLLRIDSLVSSTQRYAQIMLANCGVGPGTITDYKVKIDGATVKDPNASNVTRHYKKAWSLPIEVGCQINSPSIGEALKSNEKLLILKLSLRNSEEDVDTERLHEQLREELKRWFFEIEYKSIYNEKFKLKVALINQYS